MVNNKFIQYQSVFISVLLSVFISCVSVWAADKQWGGGGDALTWEDVSNWNPSGVPGTADDVRIDAENAGVLVSKTFYGKSITAGGKKASTLTVSDFIYGLIAPASTSSNALYIRKDGTVVLKGVGDITLKGAFKNSEETLPSEPAFMFGAE